MHAYFDFYDDFLPKMSTMFKEAILFIKDQVKDLPEGEMGPKFTITLLADITLEEVLDPDTEIQDNPGKGAYVRLSPGTDLTIRSAEGQQYTLTAPDKDPATGRHVLYGIIGTKVSLTRRDLHLVGETTRLISVTRDIDAIRSRSEQC